MNEQLVDEMKSALSERSAFYRFLSSIFFKEVTDELIDKLHAQVATVEDDGTLAGQGWRELRHYLSRKGPDPRTELAVDYARTFLAAGTVEGDAACPFESIYTSEEHLIMQDARDEVRLEYIRQGVNVDASLNLPEDHLSFELEFMAIMSDRAHTALVQDDAATARAALQVQRDFAQAHLLNWLPLLTEAVINTAHQEFYVAICHITQGFVEQDVELLDEMIGLLPDDSEASGSDK